MAVPYIGSQISLISKSLIRYEGTLESIDTNEHTVSLIKVSSFGSEGRLGEGKEIPASLDTFETIIFRGSDIKDLTVIQTGTGAPQTNPSKEKPSEENWTRSERSRGPRRTGYREREVHYGELHARENEDLKEEVESDFDFGETKIERAGEVKEKKCYDKNFSFFDGLTQGNGEFEGRGNRNREKAVDIETFGDESVEVAERDLRKYLGRGRRWGRRYRRNRRPRY